MNPAPTPDECKQVWAAVLWQVRNDLRDNRPNGTSRANRASAATWITRRGNGIGSLEFICEVLDLPANQVRKSLSQVEALQ